MPAPRPPLIFRPSEARRVKKNFFCKTASLRLSLSKGLDPALVRVDAYIFLKTEKNLSKTRSPNIRIRVDGAESKIPYAPTF